MYELLESKGQVAEPHNTCAYTTWVLYAKLVKIHCRITLKICKALTVLYILGMLYMVQGARSFSVVAKPTVNLFLMHVYVV